MIDKLTKWIALLPPEGHKAIGKLIDAGIKAADGDPKGGIAAVQDAERAINAGIAKRAIRKARK
jgi:hypothetical protein